MRRGKVTRGLEFDDFDETSRFRFPNARFSVGNIVYGAGRHQKCPRSAPVLYGSGKPADGYTLSSGFRVFRSYSNVAIRCGSAEIAFVNRHRVSAVDYALSERRNYSSREKGADV